MVGMDILGSEEQQHGWSDSLHYFPASCLLLRRKPEKGASNFADQVKRRGKGFCAGFP